MGVPESCAPENANICSSCATLMDDVQDPTIIESAAPHEGRYSSRELAESEAALAAA
jgi:hypothetical protein